MVESNSSWCKENKFHVWLVKVTIRVIREIRKAGNSCWFALPSCNPLSPEAVWQMSVQIRHCMYSFVFCGFWYLPGYLSRSLSPSDEEGLQSQRVTVASLSFILVQPTLTHLVVPGIYLPSQNEPGLRCSVSHACCVLQQSHERKQSVNRGTCPPHESWDSMNNLSPAIAFGRVCKCHQHRERSKGSEQSVGGY